MWLQEEGSQRNRSEHWTVTAIDMPAAPRPGVRLRETLEPNSSRSRGGRRRLELNRVQPEVATAMEPLSACMRSKLVKGVQAALH